MATSCLFLEASVKWGKRRTLSLRDLHWDFLLGLWAFYLLTGAARNRLQLCMAGTVFFP